MKHVLVVGLGRFGRAVAEGLAQVGCEVIAVDTDMALVEGLRDRVAVAAQVDSLEAEALKAVGAAEADAAVVAIGDDFAAEILAVATLKELGIKDIVARATSDRERRILELIGATRIVSVEVEMGQRVARALVARDVVDHVTLAPGVSLIYWTADPRVIDKTLADSELRSVWQLSLVAIRPAGQETLEILVKPDYVFHEGDVLLLIGNDAKLAEFTR
jgi:trk system potassium uptake protein TrkA